jgi:hypothetical protein
LLSTIRISIGLRSVACVHSVAFKASVTGLHLSVKK